MSNSSVQTVGQLVARRPEALRVLERYGVDYCCGGDRSVEEACRLAGADPAAVLDDIDRATATSGDSEKTDWLAARLCDLCDHIEQTHHAFLREQLPFLTDLFEKVVTAHGENHPKLVDARETFRELREELEPHMFKEERILFPAVRQTEAANGPIQTPFGSVRNPIAMMENEHAGAGDALRRLRTLTDDYRVPDDACNAYRGLLETLQRLEADLHEHIHKENNILFPRAIELEQTLAGGR